MIWRSKYIRADEDLGEQHARPHSNVEGENNVQCHPEPMSTTFCDQSIVEGDDSISNECRCKYVDKLAKEDESE
jgi:hypothetical protein